MSRVLEGVEAVVRSVRALTDLEPRVAVVLGSGLGGVSEDLEERTEIPFSSLPGFPPARVPGHDGTLALGRLHGVPAVVQRGRIHLYEGRSDEEVVLPVRSLVALGAKTVVLTNAAGGLREAMNPGDIGVIADHLNLTGHSPLAGPNEDRLGPRFPDMTDAWDPALVEVVLRAAHDHGIPAHRGVYAQVLGPSYETPAEVRFLCGIGADLVGMSTVVEAIAARHMGARLAGLSCITNRAAGLAGARLSHEEVQEVAASASERMRVLLRAIIEAA